MIQVDLQQMIANSAVKVKRSIKQIFGLHHVDFPGTRDRYKSSEIVNNSAKTFFNLMWFFFNNLTLVDYLTLLKRSIMITYR